MNCTIEKLPKTHSGGTAWCPLNGMSVRRCPTLPHPGECSTIGAGGLSFRVRDVTGRFPAAMAAVTLWNFQTPGRPREGPGVVFVVLELHSGRDKKVWLLEHFFWCERVCGQVLGLLVPVN